jgi:hypothetical protein
MFAFKSLIFIASAFTTVASYTFPFNINVYPISPLPGHTYPSGQNISVAIAISNAIAAFDFGFFFSYELNGSFPNSEGGAPQLYAIGSGGTAGKSPLNITDDTLWIWNSSTFTVVPPGKSNMTFSWTYSMTTCSLEGSVDQISTLSETASFELFGAEDGTTVGPGNAVVEDIEIQVLSTIYSCPVVDAATTSLSTSLPTAEVVAPSSTDTGSQSTLTQGSKATTTGSSTTGNGASVSGSSQSRVDPRQIGIGQGLLAMMVLAGTLYILF